MNLAEMQKVLVADDDAINRQVLGELLKPEYTVLLAKNGTQTLERAQRHVPDLILLDVVMPDMDGYEVLRRLGGVFRQRGFQCQQRVFGAGIVGAQAGFELAQQ